MVHQKGFATWHVPLGICSEDIFKVYLLDFTCQIHRMHRNQSLERKGEMNAGIQGF
nr:MAG TPA: hypothetical protein [Caudoviricetes sp.]